ncbi:hypothetical protein QWI17_16960 [Gilvimarinus sp. SDUM040013]|uniref:Uncharacterized protein n=1 Tax=Gilvimarinus gilvus TaxID=3058038 RepID=A0ABU4S3D9_9GAMM|nr:hypothetical protein [Gilvimarinus sp. SDUM040013]MDO3387535.1 hypothetical protein [Gilvimarinus sp. SDUM040013]MDX6851525.1 hypothetical protein [Gilvimarinus sp. SDUM040013]
MDKVNAEGREGNLGCAQERPDNFFSRQKKLFAQPGDRVIKGDRFIIEAA